MTKKKEEILPKKEELKEQKESKEPVRTFYSKEKVLTENSDSARELYNQSRYGTLLEDGRVQLSLIETMYLVDKKKILLYDSRNKEIKFDELFRKSTNDARMLRISPLLC